MNGVSTQCFYLVKVASYEGTSTGGLTTVQYDYRGVGGKPDITPRKTSFTGQLDDVVSVRGEPIVCMSVASTL